MYGSELRAAEMGTGYS